MGNVSACLSVRGHDDNCRVGDYQQEDADLLARVASTAQADDQLYNQLPLLKPCMLSHNNQLLHHMKGAASEQLLPSASSTSCKMAGDNPKAIKKVRFSDAVMPIAASSCQNTDSLASSQASIIGGGGEELVQKKKTQGGIFNNPATIWIEQSSNIVVKQSGIVRVKVLISKKELRELLRTRGVDNAGELEITCPPKLHSQNVPNLQCSKIWQPSLETSFGAHARGLLIPSTASAA